MGNRAALSVGAVPYFIDMAANGEDRLKTILLRRLFSNPPYNQFPQGTYNDKWDFNPRKTTRPFDKMDASQVSTTLDTESLLAFNNEGASPAVKDQLFLSACDHSHSYEWNGTLSRELWEELGRFSKQLSMVPLGGKFRRYMYAAPTRSHGRVPVSMYAVRVDPAITSEECCNAVNLHIIHKLTANAISTLEGLLVKNKLKEHEEYCAVLERAAESYERVGIDQNLGTCVSDHKGYLKILVRSLRSAVTGISSPGTGVHEVDVRRFLYSSTKSATRLRADHEKIGLLGKNKHRFVGPEHIGAYVVSMAQAMDMLEFPEHRRVLDHFRTLIQKEYGL